jgi:glycosyltransferase involved in cell wall biosynthesis
MDLLFQKNKIYMIFILPNIFDITNGVSLKYIRFLQFISNINSHLYQFHISVLCTSLYKNYTFPNWNHIHFHQIKGMKIPLYKNIKIPILTKKKLKQTIQSQNEIIIFHGEFFWCFDSLLSIKKLYPNISLYPNWHTDYQFYSSKYLSFSTDSIMNQLYKHLQQQKFKGIIVTGQHMYEHFQHYTPSIFNANELDCDLFQSYKIDEYHPQHTYHFIYTGRISIEKNIQFIFSCLNTLKYMSISFILHIIGDGPDKLKLQNLHQKKYSHIQIEWLGECTQQQIIEKYMEWNQRIFIFCSESETFGKSPFEASLTGIPIFIKKSKITPHLYENDKNALLFETTGEFQQKFQQFLQMNQHKKKDFILQSIENAKKYDQKIIFYQWLSFLLQNNPYYSIFQSFYQQLTFHSISKLIQCSGIVFGEN